VFGIRPPEGFITGPFRPNAIFGIVLSVLIPLTFWSPLKNRHPWGAWLLAGTLVMITLTGQRNNLLLALLGLVALSSLLSRRSRLIFISIFTAALIIAYPLSPALQERADSMVNSIPKIGTILLKNQPSPKPSPNNGLLKAINTLTSDRGYLFDAGLKMLHSQPITGIGIGGFKIAYPKFTIENPPRTNIHAHNIYIEIAAETGIVGIIGLCTAIFLCCYWFRNAETCRQELAKPYAYTLMVMFFPLATHSTLYRAFYFSIVLMVTGGFIAALFSQKDFESADPGAFQPTTSCSEA
jgi:O-antigen ligase